MTPSTSLPHRRCFEADLVLVAGDRTLLAAAESVGLMVAAIG
jgi:hypothetical protein